jgi:hypothetical protein
MANIRISAQVVTSLSAFAAAASINAAVTVRQMGATPDYVSRMSMTVDLISAKQLADQVLPVEQIAFGPEKVLIDIATVTEDVALVVEKALESEAAPVDTIDAFEVDRASEDSVEAQDAPAITLDRPDVVDDVTPQDVATLQPGKNVDDSVLAGDELNSFDIGKSLTDSVTMLEAISAFGVDQAIDTALTVDTIKEFSVGKVLEDSTGTEDAAALDVGKALSDSAEPADAIDDFEVGKTLTDSVTPEDVPAFAVEVGALVSSAAPEDAPAFDAGKALADSAAPADALTAFTVDKLLAHSVAPTDTVTTVGVIKSLTHSVTIVDNIVLDFIPGSSEQLASSFEPLDTAGFAFYTTRATLNSEVVNLTIVNEGFVTFGVPGLVYVIRRDGEYTYAGYTVNGDQLN